MVQADCTLSYGYINASNINQNKNALIYIITAPQLINVEHVSTVCIFNIDKKNVKWGNWRGLLGPTIIQDK